MEQSRVLKRILRRKVFKISEAEWLQLEPEEREAIRDYRQQAKIAEQTRGERIGNDRKDAVSLDVVELTKRIAATQNKTNEALEYLIGDYLPSKVYQVEELADVVAECRGVLGTIKDEFDKIWREMSKTPGKS
tara:strand:+ start:497 stop:895 length:399 start_codon:yes stop_codon:yes gene_type:complete